VDFFGAHFFKKSKVGFLLVIAFALTLRMDRKIQFWIFFGK
jgi:hypothetical protein